MMDKRTRYTLISAVAAAGGFAVMCAALGIEIAVRFCAALAFIPIMVNLQFKEKKFSCSSEIMMNEAPTVIGMMSIILTAGGSFDSAVREVADNGPTNISKMFKKIIMDADCRASPDITAGVNALLASLPKDMSPFRRAMHIVITAFESSDPKERAAMMKDAETISLTGLRQMGESYSSKLNTPCMLIFGLGIMVPMILVSIIPMLNISGQFGVEGISSDTISFITLVCIPAVVALVIMSMKGKNPFFKMSGGLGELKYLAPLALSVPIYFVLQNNGFTVTDSIVCSGVVSGLISFALMVPGVVKEKKRAKSEEMLKDSMFELGNRLMMGENYETAIVRAFSSRTDCKWMSENITREITISRGDAESAIRTVIGPVSQMMSDFYCDVYKASLRDIRDAGRLASSIAHQLQDQNSVRKNIENKLKSMLDMMTGTSAIFAPLILGMSVVMLGPLSEIAGAVGFEDITLILLIYLIELAALISVLSSNLMCKGGLMDIQSRFCMMMPIALIVFSLCSYVHL